MATNHHARQNAVHNFIVTHDDFADLVLNIVVGAFETFQTVVEIAIRRSLSKSFLSVLKLSNIVFIRK